MQSTAKVVIRCTEENARQVRAFVRRWPELDALVSGLHAEGLIDGLRAVTIRLEGPGAWVAQGLDAELPKNGGQGL